MKIGTTLALAAAVVLGASQMTLAQGTVPGAGANGSDGSPKGDGYTNQGTAAGGTMAPKKGAKVQPEKKMDMGSDSGKK